VTTYDQLLDRVISDGIAEVREEYADPKVHHKRDGAIEGFETCRGKTPSDLVALWFAAEQRAEQLLRERHETDIALTDNSDGDAHDYWRQRYKAMQIEWVLNVLSVGLSRPLLAHLPTYRGAMKYAEIVGVQGEGVSA
jgi:hypothetical protein